MLEFSFIILLDSSAHVDSEPIRLVNDDNRIQSMDSEPATLEELRKVLTWHLQSDGRPPSTFVLHPRRGFISSTEHEVQEYMQVVR